MTRNLPSPIPYDGSRKEWTTRQAFHWSQTPFFTYAADPDDPSTRYTTVEPLNKILSLRPQLTPKATLDAPRLTAENVRVLTLFCETNGFVHEGGGEESGESGAECCSADEDEDEDESEPEDERKSEASSPHRLPSEADVDSPSPVPSTSTSDVEMPNDPLPSLLVADRRKKAENTAMKARVAAWGRAGNGRRNQGEPGIARRRALFGRGRLEPGFGRGPCCGNFSQVATPLKELNNLLVV